MYIGPHGYKTWTSIVRLDTGNVSAMQHEAFGVELLTIPDGDSDVGDIGMLVTKMAKAVANNV